MSKKLIAACITVAALLVPPSFASALPVITQPTGTVLAPEAKLLATNIGNVRFTVSGLPALECTTAKLTSEVKKNNQAEGIEIEVTAIDLGGTGTKSSGDVEPECTAGAGPFGFTATSLPWCLEAKETADTFSIKGGKCNTATSPFTYTKSVTSYLGTFTCRYKKSTKINGTFTTDSTGDAVLTVSAVAFFRHESSEACPAEEKLDMSLTLETESLTNEPMFLS